MRPVCGSFRSIQKITDVHVEALRDPQEKGRVRHTPSGLPAGDAGAVDKQLIRQLLLGKFFFCPQLPQFFGKSFIQWITILSVLNAVICQKVESMDYILS